MGATRFRRYACRWACWLCLCWCLHSKGCAGPTRTSALPELPSPLLPPLLQALRAAQKLEALCIAMGEWPLPQDMELLASLPALRHLFIDGLAPELRERALAQVHGALPQLETLEAGSMLGGLGMRERLERTLKLLLAAVLSGL